MRPERLFLSLLIPQVAIVCAIAESKPVTDDYINDSVRQKLAADALVKGGDLEVTVSNGVVTLNGKVREQKQKDKAERLAKRVGGVKSVVNNIKIEKP